MFKKSTLSNGIRVLTETIPAFCSVSMGIWIVNGSRDESADKNGISHFIEHMFFKGTEKRSAREISLTIDSVGGYLNAFTSKEYTCIYAKVLDKHLELMVELLADIFLHPVFPEEELEREREVILQEIQMIEDLPEERTHILLDQCVWGNHPLGKPILGTFDNIRRFSREDIIDYYNKTFTLDKVVIAAAGNLDHESFLRLLNKYFNADSKAAIPSFRKEPIFLPQKEVHPKNIEQVHIAIGFKAPPVIDERRFAMSILNTILGGNMSSRLFQAVRERRGLAYSVYSFLSQFEDAGLLGIYCAVSSNYIDSVMETISKEIFLLRNRDISEDEIRAAKEFIKGQLFLNSESSENRMSRIAKNEILLGRYLSYEEIVTHIENVTIDELNDIINNFLEEKEMAFVILGPVDEESLILLERY